MANDKINDWEDVPVDQISDWEDVREVSGLESGVLGAIQGATLGFADEAYGGIKSLVSDQTYDQARDEARQAFKRAQDTNPIAYGTGNVGGGIATAFIPGLNVAKLGTMGGRVQMSQGLGAASGVGFSEEESVSGIAKDAAIGGALGGGLQFGGEKVAGLFKGKSVPIEVDTAQQGRQIEKLRAMGITPEALKQRVGKITPEGAEILKDVEQQSGVVNRGLAKAGKLINIPEDVTQKYLKFGDEILDEDSTIQTLKSEVDDVLSNTQNERNRIRELVQQSKERLKDSERAVRDRIADERYGNSLNFENAKKQFTDEYTQVIEQLENKTVAPLREKIFNGMDELKQKVSFSSGEAFGLLDQQAKKNPKLSVDLKPVLSEIDDGLKSLMVGGTPVSNSASSSVADLTRLRERLAQIPGGKITLEDAKRIIQQIDKDQVFVQEKGSFAPEADAVKARIRYLIDDNLKEMVPAYREKMKQVAQDTDLLSDMSRGYKTESSILGKLQSLKTEKGRLIEQPILRRFQQATGINFQQDLDDYLKVRDILDSPTELEKLKKTLPSYEQYVAEEVKRKVLSNPKITREQLGTVQKGPDQRELKTYEDQLLKAEFELEKMKGWSTLNSEGRLKSIQQDRNNIQNKKVLQYLSDKQGRTGDDSYEAQLERMRIKEAFDKASTNGSRNTLLGSVVGGTVGLLGGPVGGGIGGVAGAIGGYALDKYSGQAFRGVLDIKRLLDQKGVSGAAQQLGKYGQTLAEAASRGNNSLAATHFLLSKDPEYQKVIQKLNEGENE